MQDLKFAFRQLLKNPGFTAVAAGTLAIGIGANSALFSVIQRVLLTPLPFVEPDRLVMVQETDLANGIVEGSVSGPNFSDWRERSRCFTALTAVQFNCTFNMSGLGEPVPLRGALVTPGFFDVFPMPSMSLGRPFRPDEAEEGNTRRVILSHALWQRRFGSESNIVGQTLTLDGQPYDVVGVAGPTLGFIEELIEIYAPKPNTDLRQNRGNHYLQVFGRLKSGITPGQAATEMAVIAKAIEAEYPDQKGRSVRVDGLHEYLVKTVRPAFLVLYAAVGLVLFIACANVANLLLARGTTRAREMAIRGALGASRSRIVRQLLTESVLLALGGALIGLLLAQAGLDVLRTVSLKQIHFSVPFFAEIEVDGGVLLFTVGLAVVTGLLFGIVPAWHATRTNLAESLKESGRSIGGTRRHHRILGGLVVSQIGLSVVLLVAAALLVQSLFQLTRVSPGFNTVRLLTLETELSSRRYTNQTQRLQFYDQVLERVRALPNVRSADVVNLLPLTGLSSDWSFDIEGAEPLPPGRMRLAEYRVISPDYFSTMGIPVKQGRAFEPTDLGHGRKVAVVNETLVKRYLTHMNPLGRRLNFDGETNWIEVVGVVGDVKHFTLKEEARPMIYQPIAQDCWHRMSVVARTAGEPLAVARAVQEAVWQVAPDQPVARVRPMEVWLAESVSVERFSAWLLLSIASIGLLLAAIGLYGVLSYVMGQRTHEIGVRMALGAQVADVLGLVMRQGIKLAAIGLVAGFLAALAVGRAIHGLLYQMSVTDPLTYVLVLVVLALTALLACWFPARRAAKVDPMEALRYE